MPGTAPQRPAISIAAAPGTWHVNKPERRSTTAIEPHSAKPVATTTSTSPCKKGGSWRKPARDDATPHVDAQRFRQTRERSAVREKDSERTSLKHHATANVRTNPVVSGAEASLAAAEGAAGHWPLCDDG